MQKKDPQEGKERLRQRWLDSASSNKEKLASFCNHDHEHSKSAKTLHYFCDLNNCRMFEGASGKPVIGYYLATSVFWFSWRCHPGRVVQERSTVSTLSLARTETEISV